MMSLSVLGASLLLLAVQPSAPSPLAGLQDSPTPDPDIIPPSENCTNSSARSNPEKKLAALDSVGKHILLKLNLTEPPGAAATAGDLTESMIADFHAQVDALQQVGAEECHGRESTHFSRQLMLYFPDLFKAEDPPTYQPGKTISLRINEIITEKVFQQRIKNLIDGRHLILLLFCRVCDSQP